MIAFSVAVNTLEFCFPTFYCQLPSLTLPPPPLPVPFKCQYSPEFSPWWLSTCVTHYVPLPYELIHSQDWPPRTKIPNLLFPVEASVSNFRPIFPVPKGTGWASLIAQVGKESACDAGDPGSVEDPLEEGLATHSSILPWRVSTDRGASQAPVHRVAESDTIEQPSTTHRFTDLSPQSSCELLKHRTVS